MGWPIDAAGLTEILISLRDWYGDPELYVTENGACYNDPLAADGTVHDEDRVAYLREHLAAANAALAAGVKLRGYFVWSLLDNFEWSEGYSQRFGIIHVDFKTLKAYAEGVVCLSGRRDPRPHLIFLACLSQTSALVNWRMLWRIMSMYVAAGPPGSDKASE